MIEEEYDAHICRPKIRSYKVMKFTEFHIMKGEDGKTILNIVTLDGDDLMLEEVPENKEYTKIPYQPTGNSDNNYRRGNRICIKELYNWRDMS